MLALEQFHFHATATKSKLVSVKFHFPESDEKPILRIFTKKCKKKMTSVLKLKKIVLYKWVWE